jgi:hypothetical protein
VPTNPLRDFTVTAAWGVPTAVACVVTARVLVESVAVRTQEPVTLMLRALKVATPPEAAADVVPPRVHGEVIVTVSVDPVPVVTALPFASSIDTLNDASGVDGVVCVVGGAVLKTTCVAGPAVTTTAVLDVVVRALVVSDATSVQMVPVFIATALKVATPPKAVAVVVPDRTHEEVKVTRSVEPVPEVMGSPLLSSTDTANAGRTVPAVAVAGGWVVNPTSAGRFVAIITAVLVVAKPTSGAVASVAVSRHPVPLVTITPLKLDTPVPPPDALNVPPRPHDDVMLTVSVAPVFEVTTLPYVSSTATLKRASGTP